MIVAASFHDIQTPTGVMRTHVYAPAVPKGRKVPGLILYPEIFQQTGPITRLSTLFASHGYLVLAPEIFHQHKPPGTVLGYDDEGKDKGNLYKKTTKLSAFDTDAGLLIDALRGDSRCNGSIGVVGFCIGGHLAVRAGLRKEISATCAFYPTDLHTGTLGEGGQADTLDRLGEMTGELVVILGRQDPHVPPDGRARIRAALESSGVRYSLHEVNGEHAFMRDEGARYDAELARVCSQIALALFRRAV